MVKITVLAAVLIKLSGLLINIIARAYKEKLLSNIKQISLSEDTFVAKLFNKEI